VTQLTALGFVYSESTRSKDLILNVCSLVARFETFTAVMFQGEVFWLMTPYSVVVGYQRFRGPCCHITLKMEAA